MTQIFTTPATGSFVNPSQGEVATADYGNCATTTGYLFLRLKKLPATYGEVTGCLRINEVAGQPEATPLAELQRCLATHGSETAALKLDYDSLSRVNFPAIAHFKLPEGREHYVLLLRYDPQAICYLNPPYAHTWLVREQFEKVWSGVVLVAKDKNQELTTAAWVNEGLAIAPWIGLALAGLLALFLVRGRQWAGLALTAAACVVLGVTLFQLREPAPPPEPVSPLAFDRASVNLGALPVGKREMKLTLHNRGTKPIRDFVIRSSCTCAVTAPPTEIPAGGSIDIPLSLSIAPGPRKTTLAVEAKDGGALLAAVTLSWQGASRPTLTPSWIETDEPRMGRPYTRIAKFVYPGGAEALVPTLLGCDCDSPLVKVTAGANHPQAARVADGGLVPKVFGEQEVRIEVQPPPSPAFCGPAVSSPCRWGRTSMSCR